MPVVLLVFHRAHRVIAFCGFVFPWLVSKTRPLKPDTTYEVRREVGDREDSLKSFS